MEIKEAPPPPQKVPQPDWLLFWIAFLLGPAISVTDAFLNPEGPVVRAFYFWHSISALVCAITFSRRYDSSRIRFVLIPFLAFVLLVAEIIITSLAFGFLDWARRH